MGRFFSLALAALCGWEFSACRDKQAVVPATTAAKTAAVQAAPVSPESLFCTEGSAPQEADSGSEAEGAAPDSLTIDSCRFRGILFVDTCSEDRNGRCRWSGRNFAMKNGSWQPIANAELFNASLSKLEKRLNDSLKAQAAADLAQGDNCIPDPNSGDGESGGLRFDSLPDFSVNGMRISIHSNYGKQMFFSVPTGISAGACAPYWDFDVALPLRDLAPYLQ